MQKLSLLQAGSRFASLFSANISPSGQFRTSARLARAVLLALSPLTILLAAPLAQSQSPVLIQQAALELPDSPGAVRSSEAENLRYSTSEHPALGPMAFETDPGQSTRSPGAPLPMASHVQKYIEPGQPAPHLIIGDKVLIGLRDAASPLTALGWVVSAGYSQVIDGEPNYGRNARAYAQRLGAAAARSSSEGIFSDAILASALREDPRYYKLGPGHSVGRRIFYAATRTIITRTDSGNSSINYSLLGGNLAGSALTQAYYPSINRGFDETMKTFATSIGGSAVHFLVSEYLDGVLETVHLKKPQ